MARGEIITPDAWIMRELPPHHGENCHAIAILLSPAIQIDLLVLSSATGVQMSLFDSMPKKVRPLSSGFHCMKQSLISMKISKYLPFLKKLEAERECLVVMVTSGNTSEVQSVEAMLNDTKTERASLLAMISEDPRKELGSFKDRKRTFDAKALLVPHSETFTYKSLSDPAWRRVRLAHTWMHPFMFRRGGDSGSPDGTDPVLWKTLRRELGLEEVQYIYGGGFNDMFNLVSIANGKKSTKGQCEFFFLV